eukprot:3875272-Rhodomonas_salina.2
MKGKNRKCPESFEVQVQRRHTRLSLTHGRVFLHLIAFNGRARDEIGDATAFSEHFARGMQASACGM